jgi:hypothetical protein
LVWFLVRAYRVPPPRGAVHPLSGVGASFGLRHYLVERARSN